MTRLLSTLKLDVALQWRNGFYYASLFVAITMIIVMRNMFSPEMLKVVIPYFLFIAMSIAFYFIAGLVLLEKSEGTLESMVVSPLRTSEYLYSKIIALTAMMLIENLFIIICSYGIDFCWITLLTGALLISVQYALLGLILIARFDSITDFIMPALISTTIIQLPFFNFIEKIPEWIFIPWPTYGPLLLFQGAFQSITTYQYIYAVLYPLISIIALFHIARQSFERFIIRKEQ